MSSNLSYCILRINMSLHKLYIANFFFHENISEKDKLRWLNEFEI